MKTWTAQEIITKVKNDLDLNDETFITSDEMIGYINAAIDTAEAMIHNLYVDYFLSRDTMEIVGGTSEYAMPSDIYANKLRHVQYDDGSKKYVIYRIKPVEIPDVDDGDDYSYNITNDGTDGIRMTLYPTPVQSDSTSVKRWYIRNARRIETTSDGVDIPEFANFVIAAMKVACMEKEMHPLLQKAMADYSEQALLMRQTLTTMVPDEDDMLNPDVSFYEEFDEYGGQY